jgi:hypothetical protein
VSVKDTIRQQENESDGYKKQSSPPSSLAGMSVKDRIKQQQQKDAENSSKKRASPPSSVQGMSVRDRIRSLEVDPESKTSVSNSGNMSGSKREGDSKTGTDSGGCRKERGVDSHQSKDSSPVISRFGRKDTSVGAVSSAPSATALSTTSTTAKTKGADRLTASIKTEVASVENEGNSDAFTTSSSSKPQFSPSSTLSDSSLSPSHPLQQLYAPRVSETASLRETATSATVDEAAGDASGAARGERGGQGGEGKRLVDSSFIEKNAAASPHCASTSTLRREDDTDVNKKPEYRQQHSGLYRASPIIISQDYQDESCTVRDTESQYCASGIDETRDDGEVQEKINEEDAAICSDERPEGVKFTLKRCFIDTRGLSARSRAELLAKFGVRKTGGERKDSDSDSAVVGEESASVGDAETTGDYVIVCETEDATSVKISGAECGDVEDESQGLKFTLQRCYIDGRKLSETEKKEVLLRFGLSERKSSADREEEEDRNKSAGEKEDSGGDSLSVVTANDSSVVFDSLDVSLSVSHRNSGGSASDLDIDQAHTPACSTTAVITPSTTPTLTTRPTPTASSDQNLLAPRPASDHNTPVASQLASDRSEIDRSGTVNSKTTASSSVPSTTTGSSSTDSSPSSSLTTTTTMPADSQQGAYYESRVGDTAPVYSHHVTATAQMSHAPQGGDNNFKTITTTTTITTSPEPTTWATFVGEKNEKDKFSEQKSPPSSSFSEEKMKERLSSEFTASSPLSSSLSSSPGTLQEIRSRRHLRHVHTTVEEVVTTTQRHTVRRHGNEGVEAGRGEGSVNVKRGDGVTGTGDGLHGEASLTSPPPPPHSTRHNTTRTTPVYSDREEEVVTNRTVSRTVKEEESEREETHVVNRGVPTGGINLFTPTPGTDNKGGARSDNRVHATNTDREHFHGTGLERREEINTKYHRHSTTYSHSTDPNKGVTSDLTTGVTSDPTTGVTPDASDPVVGVTLGTSVFVKRVPSLSTAATNTTTAAATTRDVRTHDRLRVSHLSSQEQETTDNDEQCKLVERERGEREVKEKVSGSYDRQQDSCAKRQDNNYTEAGVKQSDKESGKPLDSDTYPQHRDRDTYVKQPSDDVNRADNEAVKQRSEGNVTGENTAGAGSRGRLTLLDSLEQQLSLLSSENSLDLDTSLSPRSEYRDRAEASLPEGRDTVHGTNTVQFTLKKWFVDSSKLSESGKEQLFAASGVSRLDSESRLPAEDNLSDSSTITVGWNSEEENAAYRRHASINPAFSNAWRERNVSSTDEAESDWRERTVENSVSFGGSVSDKQRERATLWRPPNSSSSELDDDSDRYSSISTTDNHQQPRAASESSDYVPSSEGGEGGREVYDNVNSFQDFVHGLKGQSTSDCPERHHHHSSAKTSLSSPSFSHHDAELKMAVLRSALVQEPILEADDESEGGEREGCDTASPSLSSYRSSFHFSLPHPPPPMLHHVAPASNVQLWSTDHAVSDLSASQEDAEQLQVFPASTTAVPTQSSALHSHAHDSDHTIRFAFDHDLDTHSSHDLDPSLWRDRDAACSSPAPSDVSESSSFYSTSATADVSSKIKTGFPSALEISACFKSSAEPVPVASRLHDAYSLSLLPGSPKLRGVSRKSQWVQEKVLLFQQLLNDLEQQCKTREQRLVEEMVEVQAGNVAAGTAGATKAGGDGAASDDLYRAFTREFLEQRQNHVCPFVEDDLPVFRFRRFLRKRHNRKLPGSGRAFRLRHKLGGLSEQDGGGARSASDVDLSSHVRFSLPSDSHSPRQSRALRHAPYLDPRLLSPVKPRSDRLVSDVFVTDDSDLQRSVSCLSDIDSAYSTMSDATSRHVSDLDSTVRSSYDSRGDVSSVATDVSMEHDKMTSLSDVFEQFDTCEGEIDEALLNRLRVGHYRADTL